MPADMFKSVRAFSRVLKDRNVYLVHSNTLAVLSGAIWARWNRVPHLWHVHEIIQHPIFVRQIYAWLLRVLADCIICVSHAARDNLLQDQPILSGRIQVVWNGLTRNEIASFDKTEQYKHSLGIKPDEVIVALVGRINRLKGQCLLVEAANVLWDQGIRNVRFVFVGSVMPGKEGFLSDLQARIDASPAKENLLIQGFSRNVWPVMDACDIVAIPSTEPESFGMVALEAMAAAKPVIAANHGGIPEIVLHGKTGLLVPPGDASALASAINQLRSDRMLRQDMGMHGMTRLRSEFSLARYVDAVLTIYKGKFH